MPLPAGTGLSRRSFLARTGGLALAVFGGGALRARGVGGGDRGGRRGRRRSACWCRSSCRAASTRCRCSRRSATPLRDAAADARRSPTAAGRGRLHARTTGCAGTRTLAPIRDLHARRQGHGDPGDRLRRPEPVALHVAPLLGGRRAQPGRPRRLDGPLPRPARRRRQPAAGALARLHAGAGLAAAPCPSPPSARPRTTGCGRATCGTSA